MLGEDWESADDMADALSVSVVEGIVEGKGGRWDLKARARKRLRSKGCGRRGTVKAIEIVVGRSGRNY